MFTLNYSIGLREKVNLYSGECGENLPVEYLNQDVTILGGLDSKIHRAEAREKTMKTMNAFW